MPCREGLTLALLLALAACQGKDAAPPGTGSGSAAAPPALQLAGCAVADPRPAHMRFGFPSAADYGIPGPDAGKGGFGVGTTGGIGRLDTRRTRLTLGAVTVTGPLPKLIVRRALRRQIVELDACAAAAVAANPAITGTLAVTFDLDGIGKILNLRATGLDGTLPACIVKAVSGAEFPPGDGATNHVEAAFDLGPVARPPAPPPPLTAWTPYALARAPAPADPAAVEAIQLALRGRLAELDACFGATTGSVRAMIGITADGHVQRARVGGLGIAAPEVCIARAVQKLAITAPAAPVELACDFVRGGPQPWRVTPADYRVFSVDATRVQAPPAGDGVALVLVAPDAPGAEIERAVVEASSGRASIVAVTATGGAPVFAGVGPDAESAIDGTGNLGIAVTKGIARVCTDGADVTQTAPIIDPSALDALIAAGLAACKTPCTAASVSVVGDYVGKDLVALTAATRRAKLATIVAGQACPQ